MQISRLSHSAYYYLYSAYTQTKLKLNMFLFCGLIIKDNLMCCVSQIPNNTEKTRLTIKMII